MATDEVIAQLKKERDASVAFQQEKLPMFHEIIAQLKKERDIAIFVLKKDLDAAQTQADCLRVQLADCRKGIAFQNKLFKVLEEKFDKYKSDSETTIKKILIAKIEVLAKDDGQLGRDNNLYDDAMKHLS